MRPSSAISAPDWQSHAFDREWFVSYFLFAISSAVIVWAAKSYRDLLCRLREEQDRRQLLNHELAHRIRNTLTVVQSVIGQTLRDQPAALVKLNNRIAALAATNDLLVQSCWRGAFLRKILAGEFAPYDPPRFHLDGGDFECPAEVAIVLALMFHELTTNAAKCAVLAATAASRCARFCNQAATSRTSLGAVLRYDCAVGCVCCSRSARRHAEVKVSTMGCPEDVEGIR